MRIYANSFNSGEIVLSESKLRQQFTDAFNSSFGGIDEGFNPAEDYLLRIDIYEEDDRVVIDIEAETYFDENEVLMDYWEYKSIMDEIGQPAQSKEEYYRDLYNRPTLKDKMNEVIKAYNPEWYFELWNGCRIQAYLDDCILEP